MVIAKIKPLEEIYEMIKDKKKILNVGCAGCTALCLAGGQREVDALNVQIKKLSKENGQDIQVDGYTVERQCEMEFIEELDPMERDYDVIISMACGAGVQFVAEKFTEKPVFPTLNTSFVGVNKDIGWYEEKCRSCGDCQLAYTGGICPVTRCAKSIFNGPCGGTQDGKCEVSKDILCAWNSIYERLKDQDRLDNISKMKPIMKWVNQIQGTYVKDEYKDRYTNK
ncbi:methylenetetrahydrofolate reductase C-terminal domain-containing protein [Spirochaetota bacterium]